MQELVERNIKNATGDCTTIDALEQEQATKTAVKRLIGKHIFRVDCGGSKCFGKSIFKPVIVYDSGQDLASDMIYY